MTSKFVSFFRLIEASDQEGCPVCRCLREDALRYLDSLFHEQVNDPGTRAALHASLGFCNWHAWLTREIPHSSLGTAIISGDLLRRAVGRLRRLLVRLRRGRLTLRWLSRIVGRVPRTPLLKFRQLRIICPACRVGRDAEAGYLLTILDFTGDPQFDRAFDRSTGFCLPHVLHMVELWPAHSNLTPVLERIVATWQRLQAELKGFVAKHDYRSTEPFTHAEARSWTLAIELLAGAPGIFGNELHSGPPAVAPLPSPMVPLDRSRSTVVPDVETLQFEKEKLELRVKELTDQFSEVSSRAAALHYRLWQVLEDRKVLELNLSGEQASSRLLEQTVEELRREVERLRAQAEAGSKGRAQ